MATDNQDDGKPGGKPGQPPRQAARPAARPPEPAPEPVPAPEPASNESKLPAQPPVAAKPPAEPAPAASLEPANEAKVTKPDDAGGAPTGRSSYVVHFDDASGTVLEVLKLDPRSGEQRPLTNTDIAASLATAFAASRRAAWLSQKRMNAVAGGGTDAPAAQHAAEPIDFAASNDDEGNPLARAYYQGALDFLNRISGASL